MAGADPKRTSWPELCIPATPAVMRINHDRPELVVEVLPLDMKLSKGFNPRRVRVFYDRPGGLAGPRRQACRMAKSQRAYDE
ncbi:hypothetical protein BDA96_04G025000 [Sorghum bicolor]|uniref:Uncharacterized protein n=1 Tax=Sorghum bicolor TaxID=4558 RepID=A0A921UH04_SORBI|nr:hypothetical protein BDA96_04G025000 [Sorghum bicolor]